jgi:hypothetical protein
LGGDAGCSKSVILSEAKDQFGPFAGEPAELILRFAQDDRNS